ncbi:MAG: hypothetical protein ICV62_06195 [Cyanobacteria bacterium Co-bin13]|nr:hypothetical protein [Cyanobacteria bacterium Co-bin13]
MSSFSSNLSDRDYTVSIGQYFGRGWEIFKQFAGAFVVYTLLLTIVAIVIANLPAPLGNGSEGEPGILSSIYQLIFAPILFAGYYIVAFQIARNRPREFSDFFRGFNKFLPIFLVSLVSGVLIALGFVLLIVPGLYLAVAYLFAQPLVIDKNIDFWQALETSRQIITKKWFSFFGLAILLVLLNLAGILALGVGILVTLPWTICILTAAYENVVGLNSVSEAAP